MYKYLFLLFSATVLSACSKDDDDVTPTNECKYDACAKVAPASEIAAIQAYLSSNNIMATQHCSGVFYRIEAAGSGAKPTACSDVSVRYKGTLTNGSQFDAATSPVRFNLSQLIEGWKSTVPLIGAGGRIVLYIPPSLGYGNRATGSIPANSILIFEIDLVTVH